MQVAGRQPRHVNFDCKVHGAHRYIWFIRFSLLCFSLPCPSFRNALCTPADTYKGHINSISCDSKHRNTFTTPILFCCTSPPASERKQTNKQMNEQKQRNSMSLSTLLRMSTLSSVCATNKQFHTKHRGINHGEIFLHQNEWRAVCTWNVL